MKICTKCKKEKDVSCFSKNSGAKDGLEWNCKSCKSSTYSIARSQKKYRAKKYGLSVDEYDAMVYAQGGKCAICGLIPAGGYGLNIDHDHETGETRELLCGNCNKALGLLGENLDTMWRMMMYVRRWKRPLQKRESVL